MKYLEDIFTQIVIYLTENFVMILEAAGVFLLFLLLRKLFTKYLIHLLLKLTAKTKSEADEIIVRGFEKPIRFFLMVLGLYIALKILPLSLQSDLMIYHIFRTMIIICLTWGFYNIAATASKWLNDLNGKRGFNLDPILIPILSKVVRFIVIALALTVIAQEWNYNVTGFIAGLGLGGLAFALAAKDAISNFFGGIVIITEKPFTLGDWIETSMVEGTVEDITFRSTRIRTFANALVTVPNSTLANEAITNWSKMGKRRINFTLGVPYTTPKEKLNRCIQDIRHMLEEHEAIRNDTLFVHFDQFNQSSLDIFLYFFAHTTNWGEWLQVKEDVNFKIMDIFEQNGVDFAFPSTSVYMETPLKVEMKKPEQKEGI